MNRIFSCTCYTKHSGKVFCDLLPVRFILLNFKHLTEEFKLEAWSPTESRNHLAGRDL